MSNYNLIIRQYDRDNDNWDADDYWNKTDISTILYNPNIGSSFNFTPEVADINTYSKALIFFIEEYMPFILVVQEYELDI